MLFNSWEFLIFFPIVTILYFLSPHRFRWAILLVASCIFYMYLIPQYLLVLFFLIIVDYFAAIIIQRSKGKARKTYLILSLLANCSVLFFFKYFNFFSENVNNIAQLIHWNYSITALQIILPIGLSFHTFQSMSYTIEVYRGQQKVERHLGIYALYVMFYPQLVAGPIERPQNLIHQFYQKHSADIKRILEGLGLMLWGFFKKVVVADRLAILSSIVFNDPQSFNGMTLLLGVIFFTFQIYCDFSGYSDIAIGSAKVMGFTLMENFNRPYLSKSISEFWRRWHISLSTWFKDYIYIPLGGNRVAPALVALNLIIVFMISGLWHGANWTFIIWGLLHGTFLVTSLLTQKLRQNLVRATKLNSAPHLHNFLKIAITFTLVSLSWIFFRSNTMQDAFYILASIAKLKLTLSLGLGLSVSYFILSLVLILAVGIIHLLQERKGQTFLEFMRSKSLKVKFIFYLALLFAILLFGVFDNSHFIYFQF
jgi:alginate O-acetyltransferase complex protein AlgI